MFIHFLHKKRKAMCFIIVCFIKKTHIKRLKYWACLKNFFICIDYYTINMQKKDCHITQDML